MVQWNAPARFVYVDAVRDLTRLTKRSVAFVVAMFVASGAAHAQSVRDIPTLRVEARRIAPTISRVALRGDTVVYWQFYDIDSIAYTFDRASHRFARARRPASLIDDLLPGEPLVPRSGSSAGEDDVALGDSLRLASIRLADGTASAVVRFGHRTIGLRAPRIAAERRWRTARGLRATPLPPSPDEYERNAPMATDWSAIRVISYAADSTAAWIGTEHDEHFDGEFALGGLLRVDRRTGAVEVVTDSLLLHAAIAKIVPWRGGYLVLTFGRAPSLLFFDPKTRQARALPLPARVAPFDFVIANDSAWFAAGDAIAAMDLRTGAAVVRGVSLSLAGDSIVYALADSTVQPRHALWAAIGAADALGVSRPADFVRLAVNLLHVTGVEYYSEGDRQPYTFEVNDSAAAPDSDEVASFELRGPYAFLLAGLEAPALRPYLYESLRKRSYASDVVIEVLIAAHDTAAIPELRAALDSAHGDDGASVAFALGLLGDSTGNRWVRNALDGTAPSSSVIYAVRRLRDVTMVPRLRALTHDTLYGGGALYALLDYADTAAWRAAAIEATHDVPVYARWALFSGVINDTIGLSMDPVVRDSVRAIARRTVESRDAPIMSAATAALAHYGFVDDLPALIGALGADSASYTHAVLALARITGAGTDSMPAHYGTRASRAAAQRWWHRWYLQHRANFVPASRRDGELAWTKMFDKIYRR